MRQTAAKIFIESVQREIKEIATQVLSGSLSHDAYKFECGRHTALLRSLELLNESARKSYESEDD